MTKFIFITGGNVSSLGKGIAAASLGRLLKSRNLKVVIQKIDPYLNVDAGTMSPYQHGEVYVTYDRAETDLDLGHYERFIDVNLTELSNVTTGKIYLSVINKERHGDYLGATVQVIPHVTNEIKDRIHYIAQESQADVVIIEVGGTVGDIESLPFLEAIRQFKNDVGRENCVNVHLTLVPAVGPQGELKTKLTQHTVKELRAIGIQPDIIITRTKRELDKEMRRKISLFCDIKDDAIIQSLDAPSIYQVPLNLEAEGLATVIVKKLSIACDPPDLSEWEAFYTTVQHQDYEVKIALVGKYTNLKDAYISVIESTAHAGFFNSAKINMDLVHSEHIEREGNEKFLDGYDGIIVPGGFGERGTKGKLIACKYARENKIPFLGLCLGLQCAVIEFAQNVCGIEDANSTEFDQTTREPIIDLMPQQKKIADKGGTMRLGWYPLKIVEGTLAWKLYGSDEGLNERHRHRLEVNNAYIEELEKAGMRMSGLSPDGHLVEIIEIPDHPYYIASQFHPEFQSRPGKPHPMFNGLIVAALKYSHDRKKSRKIEV
ncbi:MAG: CTP synthase [bacterium]